MTITQKRARYWLRILRVMRELHPELGLEDVDEAEASGLIRDCLLAEAWALEEQVRIEDMKETTAMLHHDEHCPHGPVITWH